MKWALLLLVAAAVVAVSYAEGEIWEEDEREVLIRSERGAAKNRNNKTNSCRYTKGPWSACDAKTNTRSRMLTLKKGDASVCEQNKTIQKKCKKACRYEKGTWGECGPQNLMTRTDTLKSDSDPSCEHTRQFSKKCKSSKSGGGSMKNKGGRRNRQ
ncbi:uncharacterized protein miple1 [Hetaerina americana]|uniref:uncharacterized protein miple1 n=1 Tax=Hetaerina americana TaxID=62018 RepID=UPI003A7F5B3B